MTGEELWAEVAERLRTEVGDPLYKLWFRELVVVDYDGRAISLGVPNALYRSWLMKKYGGVILDALDNSKPGVRVNLLILPEVDSSPISHEPCLELRRDSR